MADQLLFRSSNNETTGADRFRAFTGHDVALSETNHRISNNLALLASTVSMRASSFSRRDEPVDGHEVAAVLHEVTARIAAVGHLHRLLSTQRGADHAPLGPHLRELCRLFISVLSTPGQVELIEHDTTDCPVSAEHFLPLSLIVTEVVTNALKYAHPAGAPGRLTIGCRRESDGSTVVEVSDDGVGFPEAFDFAAHRSTGSRTIHVLAQQIDAEIAFDSGPTGLRFELRLPARLEDAAF